MAKILYEKKDKIAYLTFNRPEVLNCIDPETSELISKYRHEFQVDPDSLVLIMTGAGDKAFSTGMDLKARAASDARGYGVNVQVGSSFLSNFFSNLKRTTKPVIAAINGYCVAGGLELAMSCDIRIAAEHARFGMPEVKRAISPGTGLVQLPLSIPLGDALYLLLTGDMIDAQRALRTGLVQEVVPKSELMPRVEQIAASICSNGPLAVQAIKRAALVVKELPLQEACKVAEDLFHQVYASEDAKEGPKAFAERRPPVYKGT